MTNVAELRDLAVDQLEQRARELDDQLFRLRMQKAMGQLDNPGRVRDVRHDLARVKTILAEKQRQA
ncbi:MAG: 50S ribosomal protein L29 [Acidobacteria bacterium]|nr:50S ribosomal protein L29 [Acidobacteriota bacterium]